MKKILLNKNKYIQYLLIALVWLLIFTTPLLSGNFEEGIKWDHIYSIWTNDLLLFFIFLINRIALMPHLFLKKKIKTYFLTLILVIAVFSAISYFGFDRENPGNEGFTPLQLEMTGHQPPPPNRGPAEPIPPYVNLLIMSVLFIGFDSSLIFFSKWMKSEQDKLKIEAESVQYKMDFLKNQISPHFFMNTLNNIHALITLDAEKAKEALISLSQMMSYMLYESQVQNIPLKQEFTFVKSYVDLMKLRFPNEIDLRLDFPKKVPDVSIPPLLTISFIENAFKHGISYDKPSFIHILYKIEESQLLLHVENTNHQQKTGGKNYGIGLVNVRKRLDLIYGNRYKLITDDSKDRFIVDLKIPL